MQEPTTCMHFKCPHPLHHWTADKEETLVRTQCCAPMSLKYSSRPQEGDLKETHTCREVILAYLPIYPSSFEFIIWYGRASGFIPYLTCEYNEL